MLQHVCVLADVAQARGPWTISLRALWALEKGLALDLGPHARLVDVLGQVLIVYTQDVD